MSTRRQRANGIESRRRILDAAVEIAGERGYEGTSIAAVSAKCGLPASSIYWHFEDKDDLIAAVIERSFDAWLSEVKLPDADTGTPLERVEAMAAGIARSLIAAPDFLRLGLMLSLERRPEEPRGRTVFLKVREIAAAKVAEVMTTLAPELPIETVRLLTMYTIAAGDGLFIAREVTGDSVDLVALFQMHARLMFETVQRQIEEGRHP
ncbi:MAG TPA: TetR/AcrR family transcriptional regulator [Pseudonocardiaceae bacterium]